MLFLNSLLSKNMNSIGRLQYDIKNINDIFKVISDKRNIKKREKEIIKTYFKKGWPIYGYYEEVEEKGKGGLLETTAKLVGFCVIKYPKTRPETLTVVLSEFRNKSVARVIRDYAIGDRKFKGNLVYSDVHISNPASLKSVLNSKFQVFDFTKDGYIHLIKVLPYLEEDTLSTEFDLFVLK